LRSQIGDFARKRGYCYKPLIESDYDLSNNIVSDYFDCLTDFQDHSPIAIANLFKCDFSYSCARTALTSLVPASLRRVEGDSRYRQSEAGLHQSRSLTTINWRFSCCCCCCYVRRVRSRHPSRAAVRSVCLQHVSS